MPAPKRDPRQQRLRSAEFLPAPLPDYLTEAHTHPLSCNWGDWDRMARLPAGLAYATRSEVQLHSQHAYTALVFDVDIDDAADKHWAAAGVGVHPLASFATTRPQSSHAHLVFALSSPVLRTRGDTPAVAFYEGVTDQLRRLFSADAGYVNLLTHNPLKYPTLWGQVGGYELADLEGWTDPAYVDAALDEHSDLYRVLPALFDPLMQWIGPRRNAEADIDAQGLRLAAKHCPDADPDIVRIVIRNVDSYRQRLLRREAAGGSYHSPVFKGRQRFRGRKGGKASGKSRRTVTADRDAEIIAAVAGGMSRRQAARAFELAPSTISRIVRRGVESGGVARSLPKKGHALQGRLGSEIGGMNVGVVGSRVRVAEGRGTDAAVESVDAVDWSRLLSLAEAGRWDDAETVALSQQARTLAAAGNRDALVTINTLARLHRRSRGSR